MYNMSDILDAVGGGARTSSPVSQGRPVAPTDQPASPQFPYPGGVGQTDQSQMHRARFEREIENAVSRIASLQPLAQIGDRSAMAEMARLQSHVMELQQRMNELGQKRMHEQMVPQQLGPRDTAIRSATTQGSGSGAPSHIDQLTERAQKDPNRINIGDVWAGVYGY